MTIQSFIVNENGEHKKGGRIVCSVCGNRNGVRWSKSNRGDDSQKWTHRITCLVCKTTERTYSHTGEIIEQQIGKKLCE